LNASCYYLTAPMFVENQDLRKELMQTRGVRAVIEIARKMDMTLLTAIDLSPQTWILRHGALTPDMLKSLVSAGSPGGVCDQYLDMNGKVLDHPINKRTISVPLEIVQKVEHNVLAAGGGYKVPIISAILKAGFIHVLITEEKAARGLLKLD
jgi:DNA-binding transcriptional regulator LsrR (DeoR family)